MAAKVRIFFELHRVYNSFFEIRRGEMTSVEDDAGRFAEEIGRLAENEFQEIKLPMLSIRQRGVERQVTMNI